MTRPAVHVDSAVRTAIGSLGGALAADRAVEHERPAEGTT